MYQCPVINLRFEIVIAEYRFVRLDRKASELLRDDPGVPEADVHVQNTFVSEFCSANGTSHMGLKHSASRFLFRNFELTAHKPKMPI